MFADLLGKTVPLLPGRFLVVPFKQTERVSFIQPLRAYIASAFAEDPDQYIDDLRALDEYRAAIATPDLHDESANQHLRYYAQLNFLSGKFIMDDDHIRIAFTWASALGKDKEFTSSYNVGFEKASVLFNLAALYSQIAGSVSLTSEESYKKAAAYFQQAAGVYAMIVENLPLWNIAGSSSIQLSALSQLMLAQGQEVFFEKALAGKMKDASLAKLALQASLFYNAAFDGASQTQVFDKAWSSYMQVKMLHLKAIAHYHKAMDSLGSGKYGEQIAWLQAALALSKKALDANVMKSVTLASLPSDIKATQTLIEKSLLQANKDNDVIYMEIVPRAETLTAIAPARMVNPTPMPDTASLLKIIEKPLFKHLVPFEIHQAASEYAAKKDAIAKDVHDKLTESISIAFSTLASLNLPGAIEALEQPIGLPESVIRRSDEVRALGGEKGLESSFKTINTLSKRCWDIIKDTMEVLDKEAAEDQSLHIQFGAKWTRATSGSLADNLRDAEKRFRKKLQDADNSNRLVQTKMESQGHLIANLGLTRSELEASVPASTSGTTLALKDPNLRQLKTLLEQLNASIKQRNDLIAKTKADVHNDDITPKLLEGAANGALFDKTAALTDQLKKYDETNNQVKEIISQQEQLLNSIVNCNKKFVESRQTNELIRDRENALQSLENGYKAFKEISANLDEGVRFYNDMEASLGKYLSSCRDFTLARDIEKKDMISQIQLGVASMHFADGPGQSLSSQNTSNPYTPNAPPTGSTLPSAYPSLQRPALFPASTQSAMPIPGTWNSTQPLQYGQAQPGYGVAQPSNYTYGQANPSFQPGTWNPAQPLQYGQQPLQYGQQPSQSPATGTYPGQYNYGRYPQSPQPPPHPPR
ncbi:hypothetical protein BDV3_000659 [Batrachochytrium dendrobatidis]